MTTVTCGAAMSGRRPRRCAIYVAVPQLERVQRPDLVVVDVVAAEERVGQPLDRALREQTVAVARRERVENVVLQIGAQPRAERNTESLLALLQDLRRQV